MAKIRSDTIILMTVMITKVTLSRTGEDRSKHLDPFMHYVVKWPNILKKFCVVNTARFLK